MIWAGVTTRPPLSKPSDVWRSRDYREPTCPFVNMSLQSSFKWDMCVRCMLSVSIHLAGVTDNALKAASVTQNHVLNAFTHSGEKTDVTVLQHKDGCLYKQGALWRNVPLKRGALGGRGRRSRTTQVSSWSEYKHRYSARPWKILPPSSTQTFSKFLISKRLSQSERNNVWKHSPKAIWLKVQLNNSKYLTVHSTSHSQEHANDNWGAE